MRCGSSPGPRGAWESKSRQESEQMSHGKIYRQARGTIDRERVYTPLEAVRTLKELPGPKFDETVEVHVRLGLNVRHADQQLRGTLMLPHGTGKELRVAVF